MRLREAASAHLEETGAWLQPEQYSNVPLWTQWCLVSISTLPSQRLVTQNEPWKLSSRVIRHLQECRPHMRRRSAEPQCAAQSARDPGEPAASRRHVLLRLQQVKA